MSYQATNAVLKSSRSKGAARMVLFVIASHSDAEGRGARLSMDTIALESNASARAVQYAVAELEKELGELVIVEKGNGKGHASVYDLSAFMKGAKSAPLQEKGKGEQVAPLEGQRAQNPATKGADFSSKGANPSDAKGADFAPQPNDKDSFNNNTQPPPTAPVESAAEDAAGEVVDWAEIGRERQRMLAVLKEILGAVPAPAAERAACNWLLKNRATLGARTDDFIECLREQADEVREGNWRRKASWLTVKSEFPAWQLRSKGGGENGKPDGRSAEGGGGDHGQTRGREPSRQERNRAERLRQLNEVTFDPTPTYRTG